MTRHIRVPVVGRALAPTGSEFVSIEALAGTVLLAATLGGFAWANVAGASYADTWTHPVTVGWSSFGVSLDLRHWVNDGLMAAFFFVVGLEIKREVVHGDLRDRRRASLPIVAALGGMVVPALLYLAVNAGGPDTRGWAIPMATDIAFALVLLTALGSRVPQPLKLFLLTLAIVDDIGAIVVIALFYSDDVELGWMAGAVAVVLTIVLARRLGLAHPLFYVLPAIALWVCTYESGIHATIAGVVLGLLTPASPVAGRPVLDGLLRRLHPWSSLLVVPVFALANAGVHIDSETVHAALASRVAWGVVVGLVVGKPLGILLASALTVRLGLGRLPDGIGFRRLFGVGCIAGIGFTVSLFVANLSFAGSVLSDAKVGILVASVLSAVIGGTWLYSSSSRDRTHSPAGQGVDPASPAVASGR